ncbi:MAG: hypothetical protein ACXVDN_22935, partial [Ktedonobacteraceae bacterium]
RWKISHLRSQPSELLCDGLASFRQPVPPVRDEFILVVGSALPALFQLCLQSFDKRVQLVQVDVG